jgi:hypothetical protein
MTAAAAKQKIYIFPLLTAGGETGGTKDYPAVLAWLSTPGGRAVL